MKRITAKSSIKKSQKLLLATTKRLQEQYEKILRKYPKIDPDNVWHTLVLLEEATSSRNNQAVLS